MSGGVLVMFESNPKFREQPIDAVYVRKLIERYGHDLIAYASAHDLPLPQFESEPEMLFPTGFKAEPIVRGYTGETKHCGHFGCVFKTDRHDVVFKVTTDVNEAKFVNAVLLQRLQPDYMPGLVEYFAIVKLPSKFHGSRTYAIWREEAHQDRKVAWVRRRRQAAGDVPRIFQSFAGNRRVRRTQ